MISVSSIPTILDLIKRVKDSKKGFLTNFYLDIPKTDLWIKMNLVFYDVIGESIFLYRKNQGFINLYYITSNLDVLSKDLKKFLAENSDELYVVDIIGKTCDCQNIKNVFIENNYYQYTSLVRMSKINFGNYSSDKDSKFISYAVLSKGLKIYELLQNYFNHYAEQLPLIEEINSWIANNGILIYSNDYSTIQGFIVFEIIGQTSYLRYWFVHPDHRDKKIGSALLYSFLAEGNNSKRQLFWVIESNDNAIKRYEHYGFKKERLVDFIMINKNICYEG
jgi:ribosomal protein S18 acetylase RimI-like enzyme